MHTPSPTTPDPAIPAACMAALICENAVLARHLAAVQARCAQPAAQPAVAAPAAEPEAPAAADGRPRRRKLHELPSHAQDLLLALSFAPATLRANIQKAVSRMRGQPVQLLGSEADLLYSAMHDLGRRNALSDALHRRLETRHTVAVRRLAPLRDADALRQAWLSSLEAASRQHEQVAATLWALLTHPLGAAQEVRALAEARTWVFSQARQSQTGADLAATRQMRELQAELTRLQQRLRETHAAHARELEETRLLAARQLGEARRTQTATPLRDVWMPVSLPPPRGPALPAAARVDVDPAPSRADVPEALSHTHTQTQTQTQPATQPSPVQGRRVLCVGGIQHAVSRYRSRIETLGGRFEYHDGGIHDNAHALDGRLARADLVICQAGCINHAAYHRIKQHCQRTGTPCLYLERASLSRFDRALQQLNAGAVQNATRPAGAGLV